LPPNDDTETTDVAHDAPPESLALGAWSTETVPPAAHGAGSFVLGLILGLVGGLATLIVFGSGAKPRTQAGMRWGLGLQLLLLVILLAMFGPAYRVFDGARGAL
jgi:hypothetical protein